MVVQRHAPAAPTRTLTIKTANFVHSNYTDVIIACAPVPASFSWNRVALTVHPFRRPAPAFHPSHFCMKKLIFAAPGVPALVDEAMPVPTADALLLRTLYSGISNGTERNQMLAGNYNARADFPFRQAGYQTVSEVVDIGSAVTSFAVGDKVVTGTFGTHCAYHLAKETDLVTRLPAGFDLPAGALASVAAVALHNVRRAAIGSPDKVMICGAGPIGLLALQWVKRTGAGAVVLSRSDRAAALARELGADDVGYGDAAAQAAFIQKHRPCTVAIETSGAPEVIDAIVGINWGEGLFKPRSRPRLVVLAGNWRVSYSCNAAQASELALLHAVHFSLEDQQTVVDSIADGSLRVRPFIQDVVPVSEIVPTYEKLRDHPDQLFGTVIDWTTLPA